MLNTSGTTWDVCNVILHIKETVTNPQGLLSAVLDNTPDKTKKGPVSQTVMKSKWRHICNKVYRSNNCTLFF